MALTRPRYARIERLVSELLQLHSVEEPAVPIGSIIEAQGIKLIFDDLEDVSGMIVRQDDDVTIAVNSKQNPRRQRFTMAHELGHFLLHEGRPVRFDRDFKINLRSDRSALAVDAEEIEANFFAANILMPRVMLTEDLADQIIDIDNAQFTRVWARRYGVSNQAMNLRLINLFGSHYLA
jgi:Zn-dependent peptidase ImmA (M78 family)